METNSALNYLQNKYSSYDFFDSVGLDQYGRYVVYVKYMDENVYKCVEPELNSKQVLLWYANAKPEVLKLKYGTVKTLSEIRPYVSTVLPVVDPIEEENFLDESAVDDLIFELDRLERLCGSKSLQDIFYETHDRHNAVTDVSSKFPYVRSCMEKLYNDFGFDVIYEELDG